MNALIESLNLWGERFLSFAWPILWQSSVLIAILFVIDGAIRRRVRATVRYALWMLVLLKLVLPASLSLPTSPGYWVSAPVVLDAALVIEPPGERPGLENWESRKQKETPGESPESVTASAAGVETTAPTQPALTPMFATDQASVESPLHYASPVAPPRPSLPPLRWSAFIGLTWLFGAMALSLLVMLQGRRAWRLVADASDAPDEVQSLVSECARRMGVASRIPAKVTDALATPVVCGLFRPVILLPRSLARRLAPEQLQAVLLHELAHVRRRDLWVSHLQTALQILHFYNPLLWLANARIRRVREEAVDEMVLVALADDADVYPETLLNVAKLSRQNPPLAFGLIGILESKRSLSARIRLMLLRPWPTSARLGVKGILAMLALGAMLLPMSCAQRKAFEPGALSPAKPQQVSLQVRVVEVPEEVARKLFTQTKSTGASGSSTGLWSMVLSALQTRDILRELESTEGTEVVSSPEFTVASGRQEQVKVELGPVLDVMPVISADGRSIQLTMAPTLTEFLGYDDPGPYTNQIQNWGDNPLTSMLPLPRLRVRQVVTKAEVLDGQTVLLGGLITESVRTSKDNPPFMGDTPAFDRVFMDGSITTTKKSLLIFVTAKLVDAGDEPVRSVEVTPPATNTLPVEALLVGNQAQSNSVIPARTLVQEGTAFFEMGQIDQAEMKFRQARELDPTNAAATYYLKLLQEQREAIRDRERGNVEKEMLTRVSEAWIPDLRANQPVPNPFARTNDTHTSPARQAMVRKLNTIRLDEVEFTNLPLQEVLRRLSVQTQQSDPNKEGINLSFDMSLSGPVPRTVPATTNLTVSTGVGQVMVNLPRMRGLTLGQALDAIVKVAEQPIKYSVEDYAVVFSAGSAVQPLHTRYYKIDANTFYSGLKGVTTTTIAGSGGGGGFGWNYGGGLGGTNAGGGGFGSNNNNAAGFQNNQGGGGGGTIARVDITGGAGGGGGGGGGAVGPNGVVAGGGAGAVAGAGGLVGVTSVENRVAPTTAAQAFFTALGIDLTAPKTLLFNDRTGTLMVRATLEELNLIEALLHVLNATPPLVKIEVKILELPTGSKAPRFDWILGIMDPGGGRILGTGSPTTGTRGVSATDAAEYLGILAPPQFEAFLRGLERRQGVELINPSAVTTASGRLTRLETNNLALIVAGVDAAGGVSIGTSPPTDQVLLGLALDILPTISADGFSVQLTTLPTVTELLFNDSIPSTGNIQNTSGAVATPPLLRLRFREAMTPKAVVWDGQTVVISLDGWSYLALTKDLNHPSPLPGPSFSIMRKPLLVFITATLVDQAGNPLHTDADLPARLNSIPPQTAPADR